MSYDDGDGGWLLANRPSFFNAHKPGAWRFEGAADADDDDDDDDDEEIDEDELVDADNEEEGEMDDDDWGDL